MTGRLQGVELHEASAAHACSLLASSGQDVVVFAADFFAVAPQPRFDSVVGNPPYVRYQDFSGEARARGREAALRAGVNLTNLASSWAAFTVHAAVFLRPAGRLALVLPAELLSVNYAAGVRRFPMRRFARVRLVLFSERVFPGVLEEIVLLLAEGEGPTDRCELLQVRDVDHLLAAGGEVSTWRPATASATHLPRWVLLRPASHGPRSGGRGVRAHRRHDAQAARYRRGQVDQVLAVTPVQHHVEVRRRRERREILVS